MEMVTDIIAQPTSHCSVMATAEVKKKKKTEGKGFVNQCRPQGLSRLVEKLTDEQKQDVKSIGFGGLLTMSLQVVPTTMFSWLVEHFNGHSRLLQIDDHTKFVVTGNDICDVFLLPRKGKNDVLEGKTEKNLPFQEEWKEKYDIDTNGKVSVTKLSELIEHRLTQGGDDFKRLFVLYSLSSFLTPMSNRMVDFKPLKSLIDVAQIPNFDWSGFVLKRLCKAVEKYNHTPLMKNFSGCVLALQILYLHRLKWQGNPESCTLPLIQHWTSEKLKARIKEEKSAGAYGQGEWDLSTYPVTRSATAPSPKQSSLPNSNILSLTRTQLPQVSLLVNLEEINDEIHEPSSFIPDNETDNFHNHSLARKELNILHLQVNEDKEVLRKRLVQAKKIMEENKAANISSQIAVESESQASFLGVEFLKSMDEIIDMVTEMRKMMADSIPSFELRTSELVDDNEKNNEENGNQAKCTLAEEKFGGVNYKWPDNEDVYAATILNELSCLMVLFEWKMVFPFQLGVRTVHYMQQLLVL